VLTNYYTLRALVREWHPRLVGASLIDSYSQHKGSLILVFEEGNGETWSINISIQAPNRHFFMYGGSNRSRKNVVDQFSSLKEAVLTDVSIADGDRLITFRFESGSALVVAAFGPKANVYHIDQHGNLVGTFKGTQTRSVPEARAITTPLGAEDLKRVLQSGRSLDAAFPLFPAPLMSEIRSRTGGTDDPVQIIEAAQHITSLLDEPVPRIYWDENRKPLLSMIPLGRESDREERFDTVDEAVRICARRRLAIGLFEGTYNPLIRMLRNRRDQADRSMKRVENELGSPSRADKHEHFGHLLMAQPHLVKNGAPEVLMADILNDDSEVLIRLDHRLNPFENAQRYFEKAKNSRAARSSADERLKGLKEKSADVTDLLETALGLDTVESVKTFQAKYASRLQSLKSAPDDPDSVPFRRYTLADGYEVWVGKNAKQNDELTLKVARKFDLWLHARGVAGSHTVLRVKGRTDTPPRRILEQAAAIAAWHSKARTSGLAPVIITQRKYVRKPRKSLPGTVIVEREKVILIEPGLPSK